MTMCSELSISKILYKQTLITQIYVHIFTCPSFLKILAIELFKSPCFKELHFFLKKKSFLFCILTVKNNSSFVTFVWRQGSTLQPSLTWNSLALNLWQSFCLRLLSARVTGRSAMPNQWLGHFHIQIWPSLSYSLAVIFCRSHDV